MNNNVDPKDFRFGGEIAPDELSYSYPDFNLLGDFPQEALDEISEAIERCKRSPRILTEDQIDQIAKIFSDAKDNTEGDITLPSLEELRNFQGTDLPTQ